MNPFQKFRHLQLIWIQKYDLLWLDFIFSIYWNRSTLKLMKNSTGNIKKLELWLQFLFWKMILFCKKIPIGKINSRSTSYTSNQHKQNIASRNHSFGEMCVVYTHVKCLCVCSECIASFFRKYDWLYGGFRIIKKSESHSLMMVFSLLLLNVNIGPNSLQQNPIISQ